MSDIEEGRGTEEEKGERICRKNSTFMKFLSLFVSLSLQQIYLEGSRLHTIFTRI